MSPERTSTSSARPSSAARRAADGVARAERLVLDGDLDAVEARPASAARRRRRAARRRARGRPRAPSRPSAGRAADAGASASPSACACRARRPSRRLRSASRLTVTEMAGAPGFEPGIAGPKPAALPLGYAPLGATSIGASSGASASRRARSSDGSATMPIATTDRDASASKIDEHDAARAPASDLRDAATIQLTCRGDVGASLRTDGEVERDQRDRDGRARRQPRDRRRTTTRQPSTIAIARARYGAGSLGASDPMRGVRCSRTSRRLHRDQPYHAGTVSQVRPSAAKRRRAAPPRPLCVEQPVDGRPRAADVGAKGAERRGAAPAIGDEARSFGGSAARSRGRRTASSAASSTSRRSLEAPRHPTAVEARRTPPPSTPCARRAGGRARPSSPAAGRAASASCRRRRRAAAPAGGRTAVGAERARELGEPLRRQRLVPASRSQVGARSRRRSCRRRARPRRGSASRSGRASAAPSLPLRRAPPARRGRACPPRTPARRVPSSDGLTATRSHDVDPLHDGHDLVATVAPARTDDECEIDLRRSGRAVHREQLRRGGRTPRDEVSRRARRAGPPERRERPAAVRLAIAARRELQRIRQRLAPVGEARLDEPLHCEKVRRQRLPPEGEER